MRMPDEMRLPIHLQGEPMDTEPTLDAVLMPWQEFGPRHWRPTLARPYPSTSEMLQQMAAESTGTAAPIHLQGEPMDTEPTLDAELSHMQLYAAKRAQWLQAKHDADVADKALDVQRAKAIEARRAMRLAEAVADKAAQHRDEQRAIAENLDGELWALVKGEQA